MAAAVNPEREKLQQNVALKFKNLEVARKEHLWIKEVILTI